jgi:hypothetical protein
MSVNVCLVVNYCLQLPDELKLNRTIKHCRKVFYMTECQKKLNASKCPFPFGAIYLGKLECICGVIFIKYLLRGKCNFLSVFVLIYRNKI